MKLTRAKFFIGLVLVAVAIVIVVRCRADNDRIKFGSGVPPWYLFVETNAFARAGVSSGASNAALAGTIYRNCTPTTIAPGAATTTVYAVTIPANTWLQDGDALVLRGRGKLIGGISGTNQFAVTLSGPVTGATLWDTGLQLASNNVYSFETTITKCFSTNYHIDAWMKWGGDTNGVFSSYCSTNFNSEVPSLTNTVDQVLTLWGRCHANGSFTNNFLELKYEPVGRPALSQ